MARNPEKLYKMLNFTLLAFVGFFHKYIMYKFKIRTQLGSLQ